jgi:uncharacterized protein (DUF302 family)
LAARGVRAAGRAHAAPDNPDQYTKRSAIMIKSPALIAAIVAIPSLAWTGDDRMVTRKSAHSVTATLDRLSEVLKTRGIGIAARVDHAAAAEKIGQTLKPTQLLIFGNPKLGTPLMQSNRKIGVELPMKVLAWEDDSGQVWLAYVKPQVLKSEYSVDGHDDIFREMDQALERLTEQAKPN